MRSAGILQTGNKNLHVITYMTYYSFDKEKSIFIVSDQINFPIGCTFFIPILEILVMMYAMIMTGY